MSIHAPECPECHGRGTHCICALIDPVSTRVRVQLLQHPLERHKRSNTGRFATRLLSNSELVTWGLPDETWRPVTAGTWLLFPDVDGKPPPPDAVHQVVVVDASWRQARRMIRAPALRALPRLGLLPRAGRRSLRSAPEGGMSSIEAIAHCLKWLGEDAAAAALDGLHEALIQRVLRTRAYL
jgi:DTW domain-containing protein YfiP